MRVEFFFDFSSPFAYLASTRVDRLAEGGHEVVWRPMLLGAVFKAVGTPDVPLFAMTEARRAYTRIELERWAAWWGVPFRMATHFPMRSVLALRTFLAHPDPVPFAHAVYRAAWVDDRDIADPAVLAECGASPDVLAGADGQRDALFRATDAALAAGVFGAPTFRVDGRWTFWGQDRLDMVERCLAGWVPPA
jgi:2-hydroxychromene-2-carboxylate isomerase